MRIYQNIRAKSEILFIHFKTSELKLLIREYERIESW